MTSSQREDKREEWADILLDYFLDNMEGDVEYFRTKYFRPDLDIGKSEIGMGLHALKNRQESPIELTHWSEQSGVWQVKKDG